MPSDIISSKEETLNPIEIDLLCSHRNNPDFLAAVENYKTKMDPSKKLFHYSSKIESKYFPNNCPEGYEKSDSESFEVNGHQVSYCSQKIPGEVVDMSQYLVHCTDFFSSLD